MSAPYPWLEAPWQRLLATRARPAQALLLAGPRGVGKGALARAWAQALLCEAPQPDGAACGECAACHWYETDTHPDFRLLTLQEKIGKEGETRMATAIEVSLLPASVKGLLMAIESSPSRSRAGENEAIAGGVLGRDADMTRPSESISQS